jgi:hypothetical protein
MLKHSADGTIKSTRCQVSMQQTTNCIHGDERSFQKAFPSKKHVIPFGMVISELQMIRRWRALELVLNG